MPAVLADVPKRSCGAVGSFPLQASPHVTPISHLWLLLPPLRLCPDPLPSPYLHPTRCRALPGGIATQHM